MSPSPLRASYQTTYRLPAASTATAGDQEDAVVKSVLIWIGGFDHVKPPSEDFAKKTSVCSQSQTTYTSPPDAATSGSNECAVGSPASTRTFGPVHEKTPGTKGVMLNDTSAPVRFIPSENSKATVVFTSTSVAPRLGTDFVTRGSAQSISKKAGLVPVPTSKFPSTACTRTRALVVSTHGTDHANVLLSSP